MERVGVRTLRGPDYGSVKGPQLIIVNFDIQETEAKKNVAVLYERLMNTEFALDSQVNAVSDAGTSYRRAEPDIVSVMGHIALKLLPMAKCAAKAVAVQKPCKVGGQQAVTPYEYEEAEIYAAEAAVRILISGDNTYPLQADVDVLKQIAEDNRLGPGTTAIVNEAKRKKIQTLFLMRPSFVRVSLCEAVQKQKFTHCLVPG